MPNRPEIEQELGMPSQPRVAAVEVYDQSQRTSTQLGERSSVRSIRK
ncbi:MAG: hypothetical protein RBU37_12870 [Myxococcota bacterium]|nr:hypothetical protein [Myxococcota bacterium]